MFWNPRNRPLMLNSTYILNSGYLLGIDWGSNIFPLRLFEHQLISNEVFNLLIDSQTIPTWKIPQLQRKLVRRIRRRPCPPNSLTHPPKLRLINQDSTWLHLAGGFLPTDFSENFQPKALFALFAYLRGLDGFW